MATQAHSEPNYNAIFLWLLGLTVVEVFIIYLPLTRLVIASLLVSTALAKAALVALFFMHLRFERATLGVIALTPLVICVFLLFMLIPDSNPEHRRFSAEPAAGAPAVAE